VEGADPQPGQLRRLRITESHDYDVVGTLLASDERVEVPQLERPAELIQIR
jgi:hypothetical protein